MSTDRCTNQPRKVLLNTKIRQILVVGALLVAAGCARPADPVAVPPVTVTVTSTPGVGGSSPASVAPAGRYAALAVDFRRAFGTAAVGISIAPGDGAAIPALSMGDQTPRVAWSTIKVPLAIAAERANGPSAAETAAIVDSDNASAEELWSSLGSADRASAAVTEVLREGGDQLTTVPAQRLRAGYTVFGQTVWSLPAAATFAAHLSCMPGTAHVVTLMGQVAANQQWGVEVMQRAASTAVKGGWGPGVSSGYLVRQLGLIRHRDGQVTAVAMSAVGESMGEGIASLNGVAAWLDRSVSVLPRGSCR